MSIIKHFAKLLKPKIVVAFECNGCMANIHDFKWIGFVTKEYKRENVDMYEIAILKMGNSGYDARDNTDYKKEIAYQIQHIFANIYFHYT